MKKRAVSQVIATVLIILITIAAISILWLVVLPMLKDLSSFEAMVSLEILSEGYTAWDSENRLAEIQVKREVDDAKIVGFKLIFELENDNLYYIVDEVINFNEKKVYNFNFTNYSSYGELLVVKLIAVYEGGSESGVLSELVIEKIPKKDLSTKTPSGGYILPSPSGSGGGSSGGGSGGGSSEEPEEEPEEECNLTTTYWNTSSATKESFVRLIVEGSNCQNELINYVIIKQGELSWNPFNWFNQIVFVGISSTSMNWVAGQRQDGVIQTGTYHFEAELSNQGSEEVVSGNLVVTDETCVPSCSGKECGDDGCGGTCPPGCGVSEECVDGVCEISSSSVRVYPSTSVKTSEEIIFDASSYIDASNQKGGYFYWDFGDGYKIEDTPAEVSFYSGVAVSHFYNSPGEYDVVLTIQNISGSKKFITQKIYVSGKDRFILAPLAAEPKLELNFNNNLADVSANSLNAQWIGGGNYARSERMGIISTAADTEGSYIKIAENGEIGKLNQFTISFWYKKKDRTSTGTLLTIGDNAVRVRIPSNRQMYIDLKSDLESKILYQTWLTSSYNEKWNNMIITYDGSVLSYYTNFAPETPNIVAFKGGVDFGDIYIGANPDGTEMYDFLIDDLKVYDEYFDLKELEKRFELYLANPGTRVSQFIYAQIPLIYQDDRLSVQVENKAGYRETLVDIQNPKSEEKIFLNNTNLPPGNYTIKAQILRGADIIEETNEYFEKAYSGVPKVGIDENNAIRIDGQLFFPITPFALSVYSFEEHDTKNLINSLHSEGFYARCDPPSPAGSGECHDLNTWTDYLDRANAYGWYIIGPATFSDVGRIYARNLNTNRINYFIEGTKDKNVLAWHYIDEPDLYHTEPKFLPAQVIRAWTYLSHKIDPNHPTSVNHAGAYYKTSKIGGFKEYLYKTSESYFGKKTQATDIIGLDYYPIDWAGPCRLEPPATCRNGDYYARVENLTEIIDNIKRETHNLVPYMVFIENLNIADDTSRNCELGESIGTKAPTGEQVTMLSWLSVVHGAKGINWFNHFCSPASLDVEQAMSKFVMQISELTPAVLGPDSQTLITDNSNVKGNRVDIMAKDYNGDIYLFAVRLTEVNDWGEPAETNTITTTFTIQNFAGGNAQVYDESRSIAVINNQFSDTFRPNEFHIYRITNK
ncbi:MAG: LamG-like jellyroll fold domain-containing protein [Candidatus Pacearchaeota archaeon]